MGAGRDRGAEVEVDGEWCSVGGLDFCCIQVFKSGLKSGEVASAGNLEPKSPASDHAGGLGIGGLWGLVVPMTGSDGRDFADTDET